MQNFSASIVLLSELFAIFSTDLQPASNSAFFDINVNLWKIIFVFIGALFAKLCSQLLRERLKNKRKPSLINVFIWLNFAFIFGSGFSFCVIELVLRIHEILERIRMRGSIPLTNGSGCGSCYFRQWSSNVNKKLFFSEIFCLILFEGTFT